MPDNGKRKYEVAFIDVSDAAQIQARDVAEAKMTADKEQLKGVKGFLKRIWHHNIGHEYYRQKEIRQARGEILETKNIYAGKTTDRALHEQAMAATVERFTSDYEEAVHREAGEEKKSIEEELGGQADAVKTEIKDLISEYAQGRIDEANLAESKNRIFSRLKGVSREEVDKRAIYADNLLEIARQVKQAYEHGEALDRLDADLEVTVGKARTGVRTEAQFNAFDRVTEKLQKIPVLGKWFNETPAAATAAAVAYCAGKTILQRVAGSRAFAWATFGGTAAVAGGVAALRESKRLEEERRQHSREMAQGGAFSESAERRKEMEKFRYQTRDSAELLQTLESDLLSRDNASFDEESLENAVGSLTEIEARIKLSDRENIDLISYSNYGAVEKERLDLDVARAKAKIKIKDILAASGILPAGADSDDFLDKVVSEQISNLTAGEGGIDERDGRFKKMKKARVFKTALKAIGIGLVIGGAAQEAIAFGREEQEGLVEHLIRGEDAKATGEVAHYSPLEALRRYISGDTPKLDSSKVHEAVVGNHHIKLPEGADFTDADGDGDYELRVGDKVLADDLKFGPDGHFTPESNEALSSAGVISHESTQTIIAETVAPGHLDNEAILEKYKDLVKNVARDLWYDNDTPKPIFDKNELKLWWGGSSGTGIDASGNYVFDVRHMTPDGSYHDDFSTDAQEAFKGGRLKMAFSLSQETQKHVFDVPINSDGQAIIDPNSEIGKMFFQAQGGQAVFKGRFAEVFESFGPDDKDVEHVRVLATHVGDGIDGIDALAPQQIEEQVPVTAFEVPQDYVTDLPPVIPILGRRPLEKIKEKSAVYVPPLPTAEEPYTPTEYYDQPSSYDESSSEASREASSAKYFSNPEDFKPKLAKEDILSIEKKTHSPQLRKIRRMTQRIETDKAMLASLHQEYNERYRKKMTLPEFKDWLISEYEKMSSNVLLNEAKVGERPFDSEFYEKSPVIAGINNAEEVVVILDPPLGDAVLTAPVINSLERYFSLTGQEKDIIIVTKYDKLFQDFARNNPKIRIVKESDVAGSFADGKKRYIFNCHKDFKNNDAFFLTAEEFKDESRALNLKYSSWSIEQFPERKLLKGKGEITGYERYYPLPARVMRNMELLLGTKLYSDINKIESFWPPIHEYEKRETELYSQLGVADGTPLLTVSLGSSITPKEYEPEKWLEVLKGFCAEAPENVKIVILQDPNPEKAQKYQTELVDKLPDNIKSRVIYKAMPLEEIAVLAKVSKAVLTPDTGVGHLAASVGTPNPILQISNPVLWSSAKSRRIMGKPAIRAYKRGERHYGEAWSKPSEESPYYVTDRTKHREGASNIPPEKIVRQLQRIF